MAFCKHVWILYTEKVENKILDIWEDIPEKSHISVWNISVAKPPSVLPRAIFLAFDNNEILSIETNDRLNDLLQECISRGCFFHVIEFARNWKLPQCDARMSLNATMPLRLWIDDWKKRLCVFLN